MFGSADASMFGSARDGPTWVPGVASSIRHFPFTKEGFIEFKQYVRSRMVDAKKLHADESKHPMDVMKQRGVAERQHDILSRHLDDLSAQADALGQRANAFEWRTGVMNRRLNAYLSSTDIFGPMFREYLAQQKNTRPCAAAPSRSRAHTRNLLSKEMASSKLLQWEERQHDILSRHLDDLSAQIQKIKERAKILGQPVDALGPADELRRHADELKLQADALGQWRDALGQRANAFEWRTGVLNRWLNAYMAGIDIFCPMFREYLAQQKNTRPCVAAPSDIVKN
nr:hypothetical protein [Tanacetum cinerariifolium]